jgi:hypothetical protein
MPFTMKYSPSCYYFLVSDALRKFFSNNLNRFLNCCCAVMRETICMWNRGFSWDRCPSADDKRFDIALKRMLTGEERIDRRKLVSLPHFSPCIPERPRWLRTQIYSVKSGDYSPKSYHGSSYYPC